jgi:hypothetical protein
MVILAFFLPNSIARVLQTALTDYDDTKLISFLKKNVETCLHDSLRNRVKVIGHIWGHDPGDLLEYVEHRDWNLTSNDLCAR